MAPSSKPQGVDVSTCLLEDPIWKSREMSDQHSERVQSEAEIEFMRREQRRRMEKPNG